MNSDAIDAAIGSAAAKVTVGSGAGSALAWYGNVDWLGMLGFVVALIGLYVTWHYKRKQYRLAKQRAEDEHEDFVRRMAREDAESAERMRWYREHGITEPAVSDVLADTN